MTVGELVSKLQVLMINDPAAADRVVFVQVESEEHRGRYACPQIDGNYLLGIELVWEPSQYRNVPTSALTLTTKDS